MILTIRLASSIHRSLSQSNLTLGQLNMFLIEGRKAGMSKEILARMRGRIINIRVNLGDEVLEYQEVIILVVEHN